MKKTYKQQIEQGRVMARLPQHKRKVDAAKMDIDVFHSRCERVYVSVSWGKDSIVLAHLALSLNPGVTLVHWGSEQEQHIANFFEVRDDFLTRFGRNCRYIEVSDDALMRGKLRVNGRQWSHDNGFDGVLLGLTKEENRKRRITLSAADENNIYFYADGLKRCCPLAAWKVDDITAYIASHGLKMLDLYERYGMQIRTSSRIKQRGGTRSGFDYLSSTSQEAIASSWDE